MITLSNNTIIFWDSYSTFEKFVPDGYAVYYSGIERPETDVTKVFKNIKRQASQSSYLLFGKYRTET